MSGVFGRFAVQGATLRGVEAVPVDVEVVVGSGMPAFCIVGMPDAAVQEARERVRAALRAGGFSMPNERVVVNLAPGALRKTGSGFDLPIAVGLLAATGQVDPRLAEGALIVGELSLEGAVRPVDGLLAYALCARDLGCALVCADAPERLVAIDGLEQRACARSPTSAPASSPPSLPGDPPERCLRPTSATWPARTWRSVRCRWPPPAATACS